MNTKRFVLACIVMAVYVVIYEWVFHGGVLSGLYQSTASVWRPEEDMMSYMPWMTVGQLLFAVMFCWIFICTRCPSTIKAGACYGFMVGLLMSSTSFIYYAVLPIPMSLLWSWIAGGLVETIIAGIILSRIYPQNNS